MLGHEDRMSTHRRLCAVIERQGRRQPLGDEVLPMGEERIEAAHSQIVLFLRVQPEPRSERRSANASEERGEVVHGVGI